MDLDMKQNWLVGLIACALLAGCDDRTGTEVIGDHFKGVADTKLEAANALQAGDCETAVETIFALSNPRAYPVASAVLRIEGRCLERDPEVAARLLEEETVHAGPSPIAFARLGSLYATGQGVPQDNAAALRHYRQAVAIVGLTDIELEIDAERRAEEAARPPVRKEDMSPEQLRYAEEKAEFEELMAGFDAGRKDYEFGDLWGLSEQEMLYGFVDPVTGPWSLPEALVAEVAAMQQAKEAGGEALLQIAQSLRDGSNGYPQDDNLALEWARTAGERYAHLPAKKAAVRWIGEPGFCDAREFECHYSPDIVNMDLVTLAASGDLDAIEAVSHCIVDAEPYTQKSISVYFWLLMRQRHGLPVDEGDMAAAIEALSPENDDVIEFAKDMQMAPSQIKGFVEEWPDEPQLYAGFTRLGGMRCAIGQEPRR